MSQRDRLAAMLDAVTDDVLAGMRYGDDYYAMVADALLARGVRVVDVETLAAAIHATTGYPEATGEAVGVLGKWAAQLLAALDREERDADAEARFLRPLNPDPVTAFAKTLPRGKR